MGYIDRYPEACTPELAARAAALRCEQHA
jgi:hypothetical protein